MTGLLSLWAMYLLGIGFGMWLARRAAMEYRRRWREAVALIERMDEGRSGLSVVAREVWTPDVIRRTVTDMDREIVKAIQRAKERA